MARSDPTRRRLAQAFGAMALLALAGCEREPPVPAAATQDPPAAESEAPVPTAAPGGTGDAGTGPSYEVGIASAAANRKRAVADCEKRPEAERADCIAQVNADWEVAKSAVDDLRGEQQ